MNLQVQQNMNDQDQATTPIQTEFPQEAKVLLHSWMIPAEECLATFVTLKGACGKTNGNLA